MLNQIILLLILLVLSGFFSAAETALFSISRAKTRHLAKKKSAVNQLIKKMKDQPDKLLTTVLIGNNLVNVGASALATSLAISLFSNNAVGISTGIMTFLILVFGEIFPKSIATRKNILVARIVIYPLYWLSIVFWPIIIFLNFIPRITGKIKVAPTVTEEELKTIIEVGEEEGEIKQEEREFIQNIFEFDDINASEIMTPRKDMFVIDVNKKFNRQLNKIINSGFTRIPVIEGDTDHVIGIVNIKDIYKKLQQSKKEIDIRKVMRKPYFIPENKKLDDLFHQFKKRKEHMAIVVDEHGGVGGLITLENVLEEIVGEIKDETDKVEPHIVTIKKNKEWKVLGKSDIDEVNQRIKMGIPDSEDYDTFSGYILQKLGRIPKEKEDIELEDFIVTISEMEGQRIKELIVKKLVVCHS